MLTEIAERYPQLLRVARANMRSKNQEKNAAESTGQEALLKAQDQTRGGAANTDVNEVNALLSAIESDKATGTPEEQVEGQGEAEQVSQMISDLLQKLQESCSGLHITVGDFSSTQELQEYAKNAGMGMHLVISQKYLAWMSGGAEQFAQGADKITNAVETLKQRAVAASTQPGKLLVNCGVALDDEGKTAYWVSTGELNPQDPDKPKEDDPWELIKQDAERRKNAYKDMIPKYKVLPVNPGGQAAKLAQFDTPDMVRSVAGSVSAGIFMLRSNSSQYDQQQVRSAVSQMERILGMAYSKIRHLENEAAMKSRQKKAEQERELKKAEQAKQELKRRQAKRRAKEYGLARQTSPLAPKIRIRDGDDEQERKEDEIIADLALEISMAMPIMDAAPVMTVECAVPGMEGVTFSDVAVTNVSVSSSIDISV